MADMQTDTTSDHSPQATETAQYQFDAIIIGSGPGGEGAAMNLAKSNKRVAIIERHKSVGGGCTHYGTIPSKALRHSVSRLMEFNSNPLFCRNKAPTRLTFSDILSHATDVISAQTQMRGSFYSRNKVELFHGEAAFIDHHTIELATPEGPIERLTAAQIVIASGSRPYRPNDVDFSHPHIFDSDTILKLQNTPRTIIILGAGVIGCEYASIFRGLGAKVDLVNNRSRLLSFLDSEISDSLSYHLRKNGVRIRHGEEYETVTGTEDGVIVKLKSGKRMKADCLLFATGRTGNTDSLNLHNVDLKADSRGQLAVNENYRTAQDNIFAVGDVIGYPSLASAAFDQGRIAANAMLNKKDGVAKLIEDIPTGIYTIPEISSIGKTEEDLTQAKIPYEVGRADFQHLARAQIAGKDVGCLKILFDADTKAILGIHCFGERASEIIHIGQAIMQQKGSGNTIEYFVNTTFNYPTMAEAYRTAALNGLNRLF